MPAVLDLAGIKFSSCRARHDIREHGRSFGECFCAEHRPLHRGRTVPGPGIQVHKLKLSIYIGRHRVRRTDADG